MPPKKTKAPLTRRQLDVFEWIKESIERNSVAPTVQQIANEFQISLGNASRYTTELAAKGHIMKDPKKHQSIQIV